MAEEERLVERRHNYDSLAGLVEEALGSLRARDEDVVLNAERLKTVVRTTTEIKEQLVIMNGRVRENREDVIAIKATPSLTREYYDTQRADPEMEKQVEATYVDQETLLRQSDFLSIHAPLTPNTVGLIGSENLALMKPTAMLVNTSRGPIVDEAALVEALSAGTIAGAGLDVFDNEPLPGDHPLRSISNTVLTGHTGYVMQENYALGYREAVEDIQAWIAGDPIRVLNEVP